MGVDRKTALVLTGGGARGAYQVGVLSAIMDEVDLNERPFDVITGVSVGAINAASLAAGAHDFKDAIFRLTSLWHSLNSSTIYEVGAGQVSFRLLHWLASFLFGWAGINAPASLLRNDPLRDLLKREIDFEQLSRNVEGPTLDALSITASAYDEGLAVAFYQGSVPTRAWMRSRRVGRECAFNVDHIMASAALPFVFPAWKVDGEYFGDGALRQIAPLSPAIHLGAEKLFVIGTRDGRIADEPQENAPMPYPSIGQISGQLMDIVFNDNLDADVERLLRINDTLRSMKPETRARSELKEIDVFMIRPSQDIREIAGENAHELPGTVRMLLRGLGAYKAPWVLPSYLMFEQGYIRSLIHLGMRDAKEQMPEIKAFLEI